jgi:uncharacterized small protein (DUF1192 family)
MSIRIQNQLTNQRIVLQTLEQRIAVLEKEMEALQRRKRKSKNGEKRSPVRRSDTINSSAGN